jgi:phage terminase Nu1 subunit (DNA packaging protein)
MQELLTEKELCEKLKVGITTMKKFKKEGIPHLKVGGQYRYDWNKVIEWFERKQGQ